MVKLLFDKTGFAKARYMEKPFMRKLYILAIAVSFSLITTSCGGIIRSYIRKDTENTPVDFGKEDNTILVIKHRKGYNKTLEKSFSKYYTGKYILITWQELSTTYADSTRYRYIFDNDTYTYSTGIRESGPVYDPQTDRYRSTPVATRSMSFYLKDRLADKLYNTGISSGSYGTVMEAYIKKLETVRKSNEPANETASVK